MMATGTQTPPWETMRTEDSRKVEEELRNYFPKSDAYRYNSASIRVRIIDDAFRGKTDIERERMVDPILERLPEDLESDITLLLTLTDDETKTFNRHYLTNLEFENPRPSGL
jgi:stress-induced morphogen